MTDVNSTLIEHLRQRAAFGANKYGVELTAFNGRNPLKDKREELLDALVYNEQDLMEREAVADLLDRAMVQIKGLSRHAPIEMKPSSRTLAEECREMARKLRQDIKRIEPEAGEGPAYGKLGHNGRNYQCHSCGEFIAK